MDFTHMLHFWSFCQLNLIYTERTEMKTLLGLGYSAAASNEILQWRRLIGVPLMNSDPTLQPESCLCLGKHVPVWSHWPRNRMFFRDIRKTQSKRSNNPTNTDMHAQKHLAFHGITASLLSNDTHILFSEQKSSFFQMEGLSSCCSTHWDLAAMNSDWDG